MTVTEEMPGGGRGHFLGSQPLSFWQLSRQLGAKRINRRESRSSDISNVEQQFGMTHTLPAPVRPLRNFFMKEWHLHHTIWTRLSLSPHNMEAEIWNEKISFQQEHPHSHQKCSKMWAFSLKHVQKSLQMRPIRSLDGIYFITAISLHSLSVSFSQPAEMDRDESV